MAHKVLFVGDIQADDRAPKSRKDDYLTTILTKLEETFKIAKRKKVDAIIFLGDVFERLDPPGRCRNGLIGSFMAHRTIPCYVVIGNHDIRSSMANFGNSALATLVDTGILKYTDSIPDLGIGLGHWTATIEQDLKDGAYIAQDYFIWAFHANIATNPMPYEHVMFKDIDWNEKCKLVVSGHLHKQMTAEKDGVKFINPGSLMRDELNDYNLTHIPSVLFVEYELNDRIINTEIIQLKCAQPSGDVFRVDDREEKKEMNTDTQKYIQQVSKMSFYVAGVNKFDSVRDAAKRKNIEPEVCELAIQTLKDVNNK